MKCKSCNKETNKSGKYCDNQCQQDYQRNLKVKEWLVENRNFTRKGGTSIPSWMRIHLLKEFNNCCEQCGWSEVNQTTGKVPLEIDHIDGDAYNNLRENLKVLCPNCHSLTKTYKNTGSRISSRTYRK